jgi:DNA invertase Pin-like site-specific DNA recombinase
MSAIVYARASAECPVSIDDQTEHLKAVAHSQGWTVTRIITDRPMPMRRGRERRPGETALLAAIRAGGMNRVLLFSLDRLGRSLVELVGFLETCRTAGVDIYIHHPGIDTATRSGLSLLDVVSMMSHHLRQGRRERILRGQAAAKNANIRFGRPPLSSTTTEKVRLMLASGKGVRETARVIGGISPASISRIKASMNPEVTAL